ELDFTEQGGLMWGNQAVGKLLSGDDPLKPKLEAFVDEEAGQEVVQKVERRLQHFIDRKIATLFEALLNIQNDESLAGLARGFAFQMVEALGIVPRAKVVEDVKALDQDARALLRKHGVRFGQFTVFMPLLLKPAPTRLRLVLWSLAQGLEEFPEAPPPGLVTVPVDTTAAAGGDTMAGYRNAGRRAIRVDMLERLADQLRSEDSRGGFEAKADMLSITGMTLEQFSDLMLGLGYNCERAERVKIKAVPVIAEPDTGTAETVLTEAEAVTPVGVAELATEDAAAATDKGDPTVINLEASAEPRPAKDSESETMLDTGLETRSESVSLVAGENAASKQKTAETLPVEKDVPDLDCSEIRSAPSETALDSPETGSESTPETTPEIEVFYTFTWGRARAASRPKGQGRRSSNAGADATRANLSAVSQGDRQDTLRGGATDRKPRDAKPQDGKDTRGRFGQRTLGQNKSGQGKPDLGKLGQGKSEQGKFNRDKDKRSGKGKPRRDDGPKQLVASPKKTDQIDPDNPFAAALMGMKDKI
ncbi:MAG: hypothetical protein P8M25_07085, partial [Paracoccaceae bacterium]|nr:hypothetical protein [Paracoccaceae bacterium]